MVSQIGPLSSQMAYTLNLVSVAIQEYSDINTQSPAMKQQQTVINFPDHAVCRPSPPPPPPSVSKHSCGNIYYIYMYIAMSYIVVLNRYNTHIIYTRTAAAATVLFPRRSDYLPETIICWRDYTVYSNVCDIIYIYYVIYLCVYSHVLLCV